jgi:integrase
MLVSLRKYLEWLWEEGTLAAPGQELLLSSDLPKKPEYLPRPLPPEADRELQRRLSGDKSAVATGLLVMRRTGLRVGELRHLDRDCVREGHDGDRFLKVPLGKMDNERLVPLDEATFRAILRLQRQARPDGRLLIAGARGRPVSMQTYQSMLLRHAAGLQMSEALTTHRLRHSFATSLINGGMSLLGIMKLLGHKDQRMTLRYTQIADETVGREYFEALTRISERYELNTAPEEPLDIDPAVLIEDCLRWLTKNLFGSAVDRGARLLYRRLEAARDDLAALRNLVASRAP